MAKLSSLVPRVRTLQYVLIAVVAFSLGGATVVQAVAPGGILGVVRLADRTNDSYLAAVDASGNVAVKVSENPARSAVQARISIGMVDGESGTSAVVYTAPAGTRLVIESVSGYIHLPTGQMPSEVAFANVLAGSFPTRIYAVPVFVGPLSGTDRYAFNHAVRVYADGQVEVLLNRSSSSGEVFANFQIHGHLVTLP